MIGFNIIRDLNWQSGTRLQYLQSESIGTDQQRGRLHSNIQFRSFLPLPKSGIVYIFFW